MSRAGRPVNTDDNYFKMQQVEIGDCDFKPSFNIFSLNKIKR